MSFLYAQYVTEYLLKKGCVIILDYISKSEVKVKTKFFIFIPMSLNKAMLCEMVIISLMTSSISGPCALLFFSQYMCKTMYLWLIKPKQKAFLALSLILYLRCIWFTGHNPLQQESGEAWTKMSPCRRLRKRNRCDIFLMLKNDSVTRNSAQYSNTVKVWKK